MKSEIVLQRNILKLLKDSGIPAKDKELVRFSMAFMLREDLESMELVLGAEAEAIGKLNKKKNRMIMKYEILIQKLQKIEEKKGKK